MLIMIKMRKKRLTFLMNATLAEILMIGVQLRKQHLIR
jgi:hypothetical protein